MAEGLTDAQVFGATTAPPVAASGGMTDAEVFGGPFDPVEPSYPDYVQRPLTVPDAVTGAAMVDDYGRPVGATPAAPEPVRRVAAAAGEGWRDTPSIMTPYGEDLINKMGPLGRQIINPAIKVLNTPVAALNALIYGGAETANQVTGDPRAGRDFMAAVNTLPFIQAGRLPGPRAPAPEPAIAPRPQYVSERFAPDVSELDPYHAIDALIRHDIQENPPAAPPLVSPMMKGFEQETAARPVPPPVHEAATPASAADPVQPPPQEPPATAPAAEAPPRGAEPPQPPPAPAPIPEASAAPTAPPTAQVYRAPDWGTANQGTSPEPPPLPDAGQRSAGAAGTPFADATMTPEQAALYGSVADKQWLYKTKRPGEADNTVYLDGINPTMAQREQTAVAAREMKTQRNLSAEADQAERELLDDHNTIRKNEYQGVAGSDVTQGIDIDAAEKKIDDSLGKAFSSGGEVDPQVVTRAIQAERTAPSGKLPPVKAVMKVVADAMQKEDGSGLETNPTQVYGVRRVINYLQSKNAIAENPAYGSPDVQAALIRVKNAIDGAIEPVAPGFTQAIGDYATARQAFDAREALQKAEPKLYDGQGRMQYLPFHRFMNEVIQSRDPRAPLNPYQSLTETQMARLKAIHDDLQRVASAEDLAKARGSDSAMNFMDAAKEAAQGLPGTLAAGAVGHVVGGPAGIVLGPIIKQGVQGVFTRRAERAATEKMGRLLRPDPEQYPTRPNPLFNPDAAP